MSCQRRMMMAQKRMVDDPIDFNGIDQYLDTGIKLWTGEHFTLMLVFTSRAVDSGVNQTIFTTRNYGSEYGVTFSQLTGTLFSRCTMIGGSRYYPSGVFNDSVHGVKRGMVLEFNGSRLLYRKIVTNSDVSSGISSSSISLPSSATDETLLMGANRLSSGIGEFWNGLIHAAGFEYRVLTTDEERNFFKRNGL